MMSTEEKLLHYQRSIDRSRHDKSRLKHCIEVLYKLPVTIPLLQSTGIGRTINSLCHRESGVREAAKQLISKWRALVRDADPNSADEDEACVPDVPESYAASESDGDLENTAKRKSEFQQSEKDSELKSPSKNKHLSSKDKYESSKDFKDSEANLHKRKDKNKSESSTSSSNKDKKRFENRKRKYDSSSSDGDNERKKVKNFNNYEEEENLEEDEENSFMIVDDKLSDEEVYNKEVEEVEEEDYKKTKEDKKSSLKDKTKLNESCDKSKRKEKNSSSKLDKQDKEEKHKSNEHSKESSKIKSSHSSSSNKDHSKDKDKTKHKDKHRSTEKHSDKDKHSKSKGKELIGSINKEDKDKLKENKEQKESKSKESRQHKQHKEHKDKQEKRKAKVHKSNDGGIDCNSGTSFAEALGMCTLLPPSKKKKENSSSKSSKTEQPLANYSSQSTASSSRVSSDKLNDAPDPAHLLNVINMNSKSLLSPNVRLEPLNELAEEIDLAATLPEPSPYYKPLQPINYLQRRQDEDDMLSQVIHAKNQRTKVFSGNKIGCTTLPTLYEMCIRVLIENIDALEFTGGVPYYIIKPVLERATPDQLFMLEHYNPYLIEESDLLWKFHCNKDFRTKQREEMETWREMYMRCLDEREAKLKLLTANIKQSIDKSTPVRSTKLAYVDNVVKPPRNVLRKQAKYGTANVSTNVSDLKKKLITSGASTSSTSSGSTAAVQAPRISVPPPPPVARSRAPATVTKKTKAPLMAKALQAIRGRYRR